MNDRLEIKGVKGAVPYLLLYYTRSVLNRRASAAIAVAAALLLPPAGGLVAQSRDAALRDLSNARVDQPTSLRLADGLDRLVLRSEHFSRGDRSALDLRFFVKPGNSRQTEHVVAVTVSALRRLEDWFGALPGPQLTVIDAPWDSGLAGAAYPGVIVINTRWLSVDRDHAGDRALIAALARQFWPGGGDLPPWFREGLAIYTARRAIHAELATVDFASGRYFAGFVPFVIRSVQYSPHAADPRPYYRHFAETDEPAVAPWRGWTAARDGEAQRVALALQALDRYLGWPALQQALATYRQGAGRSGSPDITAVLEEQTGRDFKWFFDEAFRFPARFDYGVDRVSSEPSSSSIGTFVTTVVLRRFGDGIFAGTNEPRESGAARSLTVEVRFEDGTAVRDWWDGRDAEKQLIYTSRTPAQSVSVDPESVLLLDADRTNNTRNLKPGFSTAGARLALQWVVWLQSVMLTYSALT